MTEHLEYLEYPFKCNFLLKNILKKIEQIVLVATLKEPVSTCAIGNRVGQRCFKGIHSMHIPSLCTIDIELTGKKSIFDKMLSFLTR